MQQDANGSGHQPQPGGEDGKPPAKPKDGKVKLFCIWSGAGWTLDPDENGRPGKPVEIEIPEGERDIEVTIKLKPGKSGLTFDRTTPMWAQLDSCPKQEPTSGPIATDQISLVKPDGEELVFVDSNTGNPCNIYYALVFSDKSCLDPIIRNGGFGRA